MEPKLPAPNLGPERSPIGYGRNLERSPQISIPENDVERSVEKLEQRSDTSLAVVSPVLPAPVILAPTAPAVQDDKATPSNDDTPLIAKDDDLIEKEWVDKAKTIIVQTKDDPYRREQEVSKLQADYLRKRYGRELGASQ
jgi:hypothetical protein